jgi:hypothetical protein
MTSVPFQRGLFAARITLGAFAKAATHFGKWILDNPRQGIKVMFIIYGAIALIGAWIIATAHVFSFAPALGMVMLGCPLLFLAASIK